MPYSHEVDIVLRTIFSLLIVVSIAGNTLVCLVVIRFPFMRTAMNYLLVHLAICDMLVGVFLFPRRVINGLYDHPTGPFGDFLCKFVTWGNMGWMIASASTYTLVAIAWERYNAIVHPLKRRFSKKQIRCIIMLCWFLACLVSLIEIITLVYNPKTKGCDFLYVKKLGPWAQKADPAIWLIAIGILPFLVMAVFYGQVIKVLWWSIPSNDITRQALQISRKRVTKSVVIVTILGFLFWNPNLIFFFIVNFTPKSESPVSDLQSATPIFYAVSHNFIFLNSAINPFIYALQHTRFRKCIKRILIRQKARRISNQLSYIKSIKNGGQDNAGHTPDNE